MKTEYKVIFVMDSGREIESIGPAKDANDALLKALKMRGLLVIDLINGSIPKARIEEM